MKNINLTKTLAALFAAFALAFTAAAQTTFTVNSTADIADATLDGTCADAGGNCTLRAAMQEANNTPDADTINFNIAGAGVQTITLTSSLPTITNPIIINGFTQPGASANTLAVGNNAVMRIVINANNTVASGLVSEAFVSNITIRGLVINNYRGTGIFISPASNIVVEGCFIGTNADGTASGGTLQQNGVFLNEFNSFQGVTNSVIGGATAASRNVISGNTSIAVRAFFNNRVQNNYIGTNAAGTAAIPNSGTALNTGLGSTIGGTTATTRNVISGNVGNAVFIGGRGGVGGTPNSVVLGNYIGVAADGITPLPNTAFPGVPESGIAIQIASSNNNRIGDGTTAGANIIANNGGAGIVVNDSSSNTNRISVNSIYNNAGLGIDLTNSNGGISDGVTPNDAGDADTGANNLQNFPLITAARRGGTVVSGTLNSTANRTFRLDFYNSPAADPSGNGEGQTFIGAINVTTDGSGNVVTASNETGASSVSVTGNTFSATFAAAAPTGSVVTVTAIDATTGDTSEFSPAAVIAVTTAAGVSIAGRVLTAEGAGIRNAFVTLTEADGASRTVLTGKFGAYRFADIAAGQTVVVSVRAKRFTFAQSSNIASLTGGVVEINFTAQSGSSGGWLF